MSNKNLTPVSVDLNDIGHLYVIRSIGTCQSLGWFKIGKTVDPKRRLAEYNSSFPEDVLSYEYLSDKIYSLSISERLLIAQLEAMGTVMKRRNEWFKYKGNNKSSGNLSKSIIKKIEKIVDSHFYE